MAYSHNLRERKPQTPAYLYHDQYYDINNRKIPPPRPYFPTHMEQAQVAEFVDAPVVGAARRGGRGGNRRTRVRADGACRGVVHAGLRRPVLPVPQGAYRSAQPLMDLAVQGQNLQGPA